MDRRKFTLANIPKLELRGITKVKVSRYRGIDDILCDVIEDSAIQLRSKLDEDLQEYGENAAFEPDFMPFRGEVICARVPTYEEVDELMENVHGAKEWAFRKRPDRRGSDEDAGKWMRAEVRVISTGKDPSFLFVVCFLVDSGKKFPVMLKNIRRFSPHLLLFPVFSANIMIALKNPTQYTYELTQKWFELLKIGTELELKVCGFSVTTYLTRLIKPTEEELEEIFEKTGLTDFASTTEIPIFGAAKKEDIITLEDYQNLVLRRAPISELNYTD